MKRLLVALLLAALGAAPADAASKPKTYFRVGNSADFVATPSSGIVLMGGSTDVDAAFKWMCARAGGGDFLIIRATGTDAYNPYVQSLCPTAPGTGQVLNSVATQIIDSVTAANDPTIVERVRRAEAIWIAGGDQSNYINYWKRTLVQTAINERIADGAPVGGTSAGMNVLTQFIYSALLPQGGTSSQALADPFNKYMTFDRDFVSLGILADVIGDPHFGARDRMGRDLAFLCRLSKTYQVSAPRGIAVDEKTALLVDGSTGTVTGIGNVYFLQAPGQPEVCAAKKPLTYSNVGVQRVGPGGTFNLGNWSAGSNATAYTVSATAGVLSAAGNNGLIY
jgi:cyanophycinase